MSEDGVVVSKERSSQEMRKMNAEAFRTSVPPLYDIKGYVYLHSVAKRDFPMNHTFFKQPLRGCKNGERYVTCGRIPNPPQTVSPDTERGGNRIDMEPVSAWAVAIDILNPSNFTADPYFKSAAGTSANCDLVAQGLFPSLNEVPTEQELKKAEEARDTRLRALASEAMRLEVMNPQRLHEFLGDNPDAHAGMDLIGAKAHWHQGAAQVMQACPNCGESVKAGIAFHMYEGGLCVLDWKRAYEAGRVKREDVPPGKRWQGFGKLPQEAA